LLTWRIMSRVADAPQHPIGNALIAQSFTAERRGLGFALNTAGANLGTVAVPALGGLLMVALGWRNTLVLFGLVGVIVGALLMALLDERQARGRDGAGRPAVGPELWGLLKQRDAVLLLLSHVIGAGGRGFSVATLYVPLYLSQTLNMDQVQLGGLLTIMMIGSVVGPLLAGPLSDHLGRKPILLLDAVIACLCFAGLLLVGAYPWALIAVLVVTGLAVYSEGPVMQTALAEVAGKTSMEMLFGLYFTIGAVMGAPWALLLGTLVDAYGFPMAFAVMGASQIVAGLCILPVRLGHTRATVLVDNRATPSRRG
jgi:MFS family permease